MVSTLAGTAGVTGSVDGTGCGGGSLGFPFSIVVDSQGNLYVAEPT